MGIAYDEGARWSITAKTEGEAESNWAIIRWAEEQLWKTPTAVEYLTTKKQYSEKEWARGLTEETVRHFHLGYWPFNAPHIRGVTQVDDDGLPMEPLRCRVVIPIFDVWGVPVSLVGRKLPGSKSRAKMLPIPYPKSFHVYSLNDAKSAILKKGFALAWEGQWDVMTCWQYGIENSVALHGTGISHRQLCLLRRYTDAILYGKDADAAGSESVGKVQKAVDLLRRKSEGLGHDFYVDVEEVPVGYKDPNDLHVQADPAVAKEWFSGVRAISLEG